MAVDRSIQDAEEFGLEAPLEKWHKPSATTMRADIMTKTGSIKS